MARKKTSGILKIIDSKPTVTHNVSGEDIGGLPIDPEVLFKTCVEMKLVDDDDDDDDGSSPSKIIQL